MAGRYAGTFVSDNTASTYLVTIGDADYAGSIAAIKIVDLEISYDPDDQERFCPIIGSKLSIKVLINSTALNTLVTDMIGAPEGRFTVNVVVNFTTILYPFYVLLDLAEIEDAPYNDGIGYVFDIQATDGIGRLKSIDYNDDGTAYTGAETFTEHIFNCINKLPAITALYTSNYILKVICQWRENSRTLDTNENPLDISRINHVAFYEVDKNGVYIYKTCYDVLKSICASWGARFVFSEGSFWFQQINRLEDADSLIIYAYDKNASLTVQTSQDITISHDQSDVVNTDIIKEVNGKYRFFPPLSYVQLDYNHNADKNFIAGAVWPGAGTVTATGLDDNGNTSKLRYTSRLDYSISGSPTPSLFPLYIVFEIRLFVDSFYWARSISWSGGSPVYGTPAWSASPGYFIAILIPDSDESGIIYPEILTDALPVSGDLSFTVLLSGVYDTSGSIVGGDVGVFDYEFSTNYLELLFEGSIAEQTTIRRFRNNNDETGQSAKLEISNYIGDGPTFSAPGHVEVETDLSTWVLSSEWSVADSGTDIDRSQLLINEIIRGQLLPVTREYGVFINVNAIYHPHKVIKRGSDLYIFQSGAFRYGMDESNLELWKLTLATTGYTALDVVATSSSGSSVATGGGSTSTGGSGGGSGGTTTSVVTKYFKESFTGSDFSSNMFTVTVNGGILPGDAAQIVVFYNGQYTDEWSHSGSDITMSFQIYYSDVIVVHFFINV